MICCECGDVEAGKPSKSGRENLPRGWKEHPEGQHHCRRCWGDNWCLRTVTIPVAGPVDGTWEEFRAALKSCWSRSTQWANWAVRELVRNDVVRLPEHERMPAMPPVYLYGLAREQGFPVADSQSRQAVFRDVERKYRASRYRAIWLRSQAPPSYRYPVPFPVHDDAWKVSFGDDGEILVSLPLDGRRWVIRLRGGAEFRRQRGDVRRIVSGGARQGQAAVYSRRVQVSANRNGVDGRDPGGGRNGISRVMFKFVIQVPKRSGGQDGSTLHVRSDAGSFLVYRVDDGDVKYLHADHLRRWIAGHRRKLDRMSDDLKHEKRWPKRVRRKAVESKDGWLRKHHHRLDSFTHEASAMLAGFAARNRVSRVSLDLSERSFVAEFPWHQFQERLAYKLDERRISLDVVAGAAADEDAGDREGGGD